MRKVPDGREVAAGRKAARLAVQYPHSAATLRSSPSSYVAKL